MTNQLDFLRQYTTVVADTGDFEAMRAHRPTDATTNPSLILKAVQKDTYRPLLQEVVARHPGASPAELMDRLLVAFGLRILDIVPGRVSTEVDARLSFDVRGTIERARSLVALYEAAGVPRERVLIKIAATWEGIQAARVLQSEGIRCNMTLLVSLPQAAACADARVQLISPFVGRIYDWYKKSAGDKWNEAEHAGERDPGVQSVARIYRYYKQHGIATEVMGASFRNTGQILALAGCDLLTISPELLAQLDAAEGDVPRRLAPQAADEEPLPYLSMDEVAFRTALNEDAMATEKLAEGIRIFVADAVKLEALIEAARACVQGGPPGPALALVVRMDLQRFEEARHHVVGSHRGGQFDQLALRQHGLHRRKHLGRHLDLAGHGIRVGQHRALALAEQIRFLPLVQRIELGLGDAFLERDRRMLVGFVGRAVEHGHPHDDQFAQIPRQRRLLADRGQVVEPAAGHRRAVQQHLVQMQHAAALGDDAIDQGLGLGVLQIGVRNAGHADSRRNGITVWIVPGQPIAA